MSRDTTVIAFRQPEAIDDPLSELAREGARRMLAQVLIAEADSSRVLAVRLTAGIRIRNGLASSIVPAGTSLHRSAEFTLVARLGRHSSRRHAQP
jgi:hypothetical protein